MKKVISMSAKPLAMATAIVAGASASMVTMALPTMVNESVCNQSVDMTIAPTSARSITTGTGTCQLRTLPPTKGFVLTSSTPAGATVADSSPMVNEGGELYATYVGGKRSGATLLTPNRALATSHAVSYQSGAKGAVAYDFAASVQPSTGLQASWLTGSYRIANSQHGWGDFASGLEHSSYASPNIALSMYNFTSLFTVKFNGDNTCTVTDVNSHWAANLTKDPTLDRILGGEQDVNCYATGSPTCSQNDGNNYTAVGAINAGTTGQSLRYPLDWQSQYLADPNGRGLYQDSCTYSVTAGQVTVNYGFNTGDAIDGWDGVQTWSTTYNVSSDLRYLVTDGNSGSDGLAGATDRYAKQGNISVGVRQGSVALVGNTYLFNAMENTLAESTPATASYELPVTPVYQEEQCFSRGSLALAAAGACTYNVVSSCTGRNHSGLEENTSTGINGGTPTSGTGSGTIVDSLAAFNGSPATAPTCSWSGDSTNLVVSVGVQDQTGNPITMTYKGSASDNGEALVLQGIYNVTGGGLGDTNNPPMLNSEKYNIESYLVAQQYQGSLTADADANGVNNYGEFVWAKAINKAKSNATDFNGDGIADIAMRNTANNESYIFTFANYQSTGYAFSGLFPSLQWNWMASGDFDGNGTTDVLLRKDNGEWQLFKMGGSNGTAQSYAPIGLFAGNYTIVAKGDFDGSGNTSIIMENPSTQEYWRFTIVNGVVTSQAAVGLWGGTWTVSTVADFNNDGVADVLMNDPSSGQWALFTFSGGNVVSGGIFPLYGGTWQLKAVEDFNGDGQKDVLMQNSADGSWAVFIVNNGTVSSVVSPNLFPSTSWQFSFASDVNGDGIADVVYQNPSNGLWFVGIMNSSAVATNQNLALWDSSAWTLAALGDYNGDGTNDVILYNSTKNEYWTFPILNGSVGTAAYSNLFLAPSTTWPLMK